jgi:photosystem II stability/assembly factor-like uncharacterized protein
MTSAILGTEAGVFWLGNGELRPLGLGDHRISAIFARERSGGAVTILAGSYGDGLFRSEDSGEQWVTVSDGLTAPAFRAFAQDPADTGAILCGTEPGRIFRSRDDGASWRELEGIRALEGVDDWYLPYSPRAGAVRNIYGPPGTTRLLASVEVGGLLESPDGGETWDCRPLLGDTDIHHITGQPDDADLLYAALGWASLKNLPRDSDAPPLGGVARSRDGGQSWEKFHSDYTRAVIVPPTRRDLVLAGPASAVGEGGRIEVSSDGGDTWSPAGSGIESPMEDMVELFVPAPDGWIWAICGGGRLIQAEPGTWQWCSPLPADAKLKVQSVAFV